MNPSTQHFYVDIFDLVETEYMPNFEYWVWTPEIMHNYARWKIIPQSLDASQYAINYSLIDDERNDLVVFDERIDKLQVRIFSEDFDLAD